MCNYSDYPHNNPSNSDSAAGDGDTCVVCLDSFLDDDLIKILKCKHIFHACCIDEWLEKHNYKCPICRNPATNKPNAII